MRRRGRRCRGHRSEEGGGAKPRNSRRHPTRRRRRRHLRPLFRPFNARTYAHNTKHKPGFDSRAYRLARPGVKFFEIDLPHTSAQKRALVDRALPDAARHPRPEFVAADLSRVTTT